MATRDQWANFVTFISQLIFVNTIGIIFFFDLNNKVLGVKTIALGYLLLAISFLALITPPIINKFNKN